MLDGGIYGLETRGRLRKHWQNAEDDLTKDVDPEFEESIQGQECMKTHDGGQDSP